MENILRKKFGSFRAFWSLFCSSFAGLIALQTFAQANTQAESSQFRLLHFGVTERITTQNTFSGINLSTMLTWNPHYELFSWLNIEGQLGGTLMTSNLGTFVALRYQAGVSFHAVFDANDHWVPEVLFGSETWAISAGGSYFVGSINLHYRFRFQDAGYLNWVDAIHIGYQWLPGAPGSAQQYAAGLRIVPSL